jgi:hypothetical protein
MSTVQSHAMFDVWSPDEVAECLSFPDPTGDIYRALWDLVRHYDKQPRSEVPDDFDRRCLANWWSELPPDTQVVLNEAAEQEEKGWRA